jgi:hypothetical protein
MNSNEIPSYFENFMTHYNPSTVIGTTEFMIRTSLGVFRMRGETIAHCLMDLYNMKKGEFTIFGGEIVHNSKQK